MVVLDGEQQRRASTTVTRLDIGALAQGNRDCIRVAGTGGREQIGVRVGGAVRFERGAQRHRNCRLAMAFGVSERQHAVARRTKCEIGTASNE